MYKIPNQYKSEIKEYRNLISEMEQGGGIDPLRFKIYRVIRGIYEQRNKGSYMVRVRCAAGTISPQQFGALADIASKYGSTFLHITTRQELQLHDLNLSDTPDILEELFKLGLTTKGSGGNTVRNITASVESGISAMDDFDITPFAIALTNHLIDFEKSFDLPRKLKIAFSSSDADSALACYNDLGFIAKTRNGERGFKVYLGGSPSVKPMVGEVLFDFISAPKILGVALAVIEMFHRYGNRKNRHKARLRYMFYDQGKDMVFQLFNETYNQFTDYELRPEETAQKVFCEEPGLRIGNSNSKAFEQWRRNYVNEQKGSGLLSVEVPVLHGNISLKQVKAIAEFAANLGEENIRFSRRQNLHLRNIPDTYLGLLYKILKRIGIRVDEAYLLGNLVSCTGADTCQLGICFSKGGLQAVHKELSNKRELSSLKDFTINISGCPNACGQHLVADLGFAGRVSRKGRIYPAYTVFAGAKVGDGISSLPIKIGEVAAKDLPVFTSQLLEAFRTSKHRNSFRGFVENEKELVGAITKRFKDIPDFEQDRKYYIDFGNNDLFSLEARGTGECSAGTLDLIESEIKKLESCKRSLTGQQEVAEKTVLLHQLVLSASILFNLLLGETNLNEKDLFRTIKKRLIDSRQLPGEYATLFEFLLQGNFTSLLKAEDRAVNYADAAIAYFKELDESLQPQIKLNEMTALALKSLMDNDVDYTLIDVREDWEKKIADIGGELIPLSKLSESLERIPANKKTILYCRTGRRSSEAIMNLAKLRSVENLYNLRGGIFAWSDEIDTSIQKY